MAKKKKIHRIPLHKVIEGHFLWCSSLRYSPNTINDYKTTFRYFMDFVGAETVLDDITPADVEAFLAHMADSPITYMQGVTEQYAKGNERKRRRSAKTLRNYHTGLSSLWTYATTHDYASEHILHDVKGAYVPKVPVQPLTADEVKKLLKACTRTRPYKNKVSHVTNWRITSERDKAIIAMAVETGLRASELCDLKIKDVIFGVGGGNVYVESGKGDKSRQVPFGPKCASILHKWTIVRDSFEPNDPFFINLQRNAGMAMQRAVLGRLIKRIGKKAGIRVTPHRLRHTAACMMVQNGMNAFTVQRILGHENINTTMRYVRAANIDMEKAMRNASPLQNIRL